LLIGVVTERNSGGFEVCPHREIIIANAIVVIIVIVIAIAAVRPLNFHRLNSARRRFVRFIYWTCKSTLLENQILFAISQGDFHVQFLLLWFSIVYEFWVMRHFGFTAPLRLL
jgi:hypothetical protein